MKIDAYARLPSFLRPLSQIRKHSYLIVMLASKQQKRRKHLQIMSDLGIQLTCKIARKGCHLYAIEYVCIVFAVYIIIYDIRHNENTTENSNKNVACQGLTKSAENSK